MKGRKYWSQQGTIGKILPSNLDQTRLPVNTILLVTGILVVWQAISLFYASHQFPNILELGAALIEVFDGSGMYTFTGSVPITIARIILSVVFAMLIGVPFGIAMGLYTTFEDFLLFYLLIFLAIPAIMWAFLGVIWFGLSPYLVPVLAGMLTLLPYVIVNTWKGTQDVDADLLEMATVFGLSTVAVWRHVLIPHLLPYLFSTSRMVFAIGWRVMLIIEVFGAGSGLGYVINAMFQAQRNDLLLAWAIPVVAVIVVLERLLKRYEDRAFDWRDENGLEVTR